MSSTFRLSIGVNILLLGIVAALLWRDRSAARSPVAARERPVSVRSETPKTDAVLKKLPPEPAGPKLTPAAIAGLEQSGISRETLVNVLLEDLNRRSAKRLLELQKKYAPRLVPDREMVEFSRQCDAEQIRELKAALGEAGYLAWDKEQVLRDLNRARVPGDDLPMTAEEAERVYRLQKEFDRKNKELQMAMEDGIFDQADVGPLRAQAQEALDRELEKLLGKPRFNELRGNSDPTTEVYRTFGDLNPTPDQANAVLLAEGDFRTREATLIRRLNENPEEAANVPAELQAMNDAREESLRRIFGAEAYDTMKRQNDPTYKTLKQYAETWALKDDEIQSVYDTLHGLQVQTDRTRTAAEMNAAAGQRVNWREINSAIEQVQRQTEAALQALIGDERLQRLKQNGMLTTR